MVAGATGAPLRISRRGLRPKAMAAISSILAIAISTSGTSRINPSVKAKAEQKNEVVPGPVGEYGCDPGSDAVGGRRQQQRLHHGGKEHPQDRQRQQDADQ